MTLQIHGIVKQPQDIDGCLSFDIDRPKQYKVAAFSPVASYVEGQHPRSDVTAFFGAWDGWTGRQVFQGSGEGIGVDACLPLAKVSQRPAQNFAIVRLGACRQTNAPAVGAHGVPMISVATAAKCRSSASCDAKL